MWPTINEWHMIFKKTGKTKKKKTKKQLIIRLVVYIIVSVSLCIGLIVYLSYEQSRAERAYEIQNSPDILSPAMLEAQAELSTIIEEREKLPVTEVNEVMDQNEIIWDIGEIGHCFDNLRTLKGSTKYESIGKYRVPEKSKKALRETFDVLEDRGYSIGFIVLDLQTGEGVSYNCDHEFFSASSVKGPYMVSLINYAPESLEEYGYNFKAIAATSDNRSYNNLFMLYGNEYFNRWCEEAGISLRMADDYNYVYYSPRMLASLWLLNYRFFITNEEYGDKAAELFDHPSYSTIHTALGPFYKTLTKSGWINLRYHAIIDSGIVSDGEDPFMIILMSDYSGDLLELNAVTCELERIHADIVGKKSKITNKYIEEQKKEYPLGYWWR